VLVDEARRREYDYLTGCTSQRAWHFETEGAFQSDVAQSAILEALLRELAALGVDVDTLSRRWPGDCPRGYGR